ncbi:S16 family serine protease [Mycoplasma corogypsi]|uniref:S16 family serine protease n=1 Tax=Mycoplasma corogypsi TaxID=2106 RepID=UPI003872C59E
MNQNKIISVSEIRAKFQGNSAGISITTALLSYYLDIPINNNIAFTGAIAPEESVKAIGGLEYKLLACNDSNIETVFIPYENKMDYEKIKKDIDLKFEVVLVKKYEEIFDRLFKNNKSKLLKKINK